MVEAESLAVWVYISDRSESTMSDSPSLIMIQFLSWVADRPRSYTETMDAWRTSCPRLSVWEDAVIADLVRLEGEGGRAVKLTDRGAKVLRQGQNRGRGPAHSQRKREGGLGGAGGLGKKAAPGGVGSAEGLSPNRRIV